MTFLNPFLSRIAHYTCHRTYFNPQELVLVLLYLRDVLKQNKKNKQTNKKNQDSHIEIYEHCRKIGSNMPKPMENSNFLTRHLCKLVTVNIVNGSTYLHHILFHLFLYLVILFFIISSSRFFFVTMVSISLYLSLSLSLPPSLLLSLSASGCGCLTSKIFLYNSICRSDCLSFSLARSLLLFQVQASPFSVQATLYLTMACMNILLWPFSQP